MEPITEKEILTPTKKRLLAKREAKGVTPAKAFVSITLEGMANVHNEVGGQGVLVYGAILSSYRVTEHDKRETGFTVRNVFRDASGVDPRQFRRAVNALDAAGYIRATAKPGSKARITLTGKGKQALPGPVRETPQA